MWKKTSLKFLISALPIAVLTFPVISFSAIAQTTFGETGQDGDRGRHGRSGRDGQDLKIVVDGKSASYDLTGAIGEDGEDGSAGRSASSCEQPYRPEYSLIGAAGGRGGDGGNGGKGGDGGNVTLFYTDIAMLKQIEIRNAGGKGGRNGRGAIGGKGCECQETEWRVRYCSWEIQRRPFKDPKAEWKYHDQETELCGRRDNFGFNQGTRKSTEYRHDDWLYRRTYQGVSRSNSYTCQRGDDGETSNDGLNGKTGNYGNITLVPRLDIPAEIKGDRRRLSDALGKTVGLIKNIWVDRRGLSRLLRASSDVEDRYTYLKDTARLFYRFEWAAPNTPAALGLDRLEIGAEAKVRNENAEIDYQLPGTLEYQVMTEPNLEVVKITGGFHPDRVSSFELQKISGIGTDNQLILSDRGNVRELLKETQIEVQCFSKESATGILANDYVQRRTVTFKIPPKLEPSNGAIVNGNSSTYTLPMGRYCSPWLKNDYNAAYAIAITQITKSGAIYDQNLKSIFVVGQN